MHSFFVASLRHYAMIQTDRFGKQLVLDGVKRLLTPSSVIENQILMCYICVLYHAAISRLSQKNKFSHSYVIYGMIQVHNTSMICKTLKKRKEIGKKKKHDGNTDDDEDKEDKEIENEDLDDGKNTNV